jgi:hypothetical protein
MLNSLVVTIAFLAAAAIIFSKRVQASKDWQATVTPLASIIGSGFLVSVPLLASEVGYFRDVCIDRSSVPGRRGDQI